MMSELYRHCPECAEDRVFEQPHLADCPDTPDGECPELACTVCGAALIAASSVPASARASGQRAA